MSGTYRILSAEIRHAFFVALNQLLAYENASGALEVVVLDRDVMIEV